ncbi:hypothetical protein [Escherichia phage vB_EcoM_EP57]|nr:hypothetical protein [Escherichia phage vB_EcoM_EP57]
MLNANFRAVRSTQRQFPNIMRMRIIIIRIQ